ncbi:MAG: dihydrodipicolinate synthase family protein [Litorilinea sp.]
MSNSKPMRGIYTIPATPFDEQYAIDEAGLRQIIDFCIGCGAHGLVYPVNASGFSTLSDAERIHASRIVVEQCAGRIPVVIGVQGVCKEHAVTFAREAKAMQADAVIAMTPYINKVSNEELITDYFQGISQAAQLPVFIQNHSVGSELSVSLMARLLAQVEHVKYIKEETYPVTHKLSQILEAAGDNVHGVFGGAGGRYLLLEHPRGVAGQMPGCQVTDVVVALWDALEAGDRAKAKQIHGSMSALFAFEEQAKGLAYKEILRRRGVIASGRTRNMVDSLDAQDHQALDEILRDLEPLFTWHA